MRRAGTGLLAVLAAGAASAALAQASGKRVDEPGPLPGPPLSVADAAYDSRLLSSVAAAEQFQGALDGGWTLSADGQGDLYAFQLVDKRDRLEGAWRDLRRPRGPAASGLLEQVERTPQGVVMRFSPAAQAPVEVTLRPDLRGELVTAGRRLPVALRKAAP